MSNLKTPYLDKEIQEIQDWISEVKLNSFMSEAVFNDQEKHLKEYQSIKAALKELKEAKALFQAAKNYIDVCHCDPDITNEQLEAWTKYEELLKED